MLEVPSRRRPAPSVSPPSSPSAAPSATKPPGSREGKELPEEEPQRARAVAVAARHGAGVGAVAVLLRRPAALITRPGARQRRSAASGWASVPRLRRTSPDQPGWTRRRAGKGFVYLDEHGERLTDAERAAGRATW